MGHFSFIKWNIFIIPKCLFINTPSAGISIFPSALLRAANTNSLMESTSAARPRSPGKEQTRAEREHNNRIFLSPRCRRNTVGVLPRNKLVLQEEGRGWNTQHRMFRNHLECSAAALGGRKGTGHGASFALPVPWDYKSIPAIIHPSDLQLCSLSALAGRKEL